MSRRSLRQWLLTMQLSQILSKSLAAFQPGLPHWKRMQRPYPVVRARQDLGIYLHTVMAPQPLGVSGPMVQGHLLTIEIRGVDLILSQAPKMNMHGVPSYYGSHVNNTTLGLQIGSITFGKSQTYQSITNPSEFIAKQVPYQPDLYSKQERIVRTLWPDTEMMVFPMKTTAHSATPKQISWSANPSHLKNGKLENNLRPSGRFWPKNSKFSSLMETTQAHSLSLRLTPVHKFSASRIEEAAWENQCSNLPLVEADSCLPLLHLICVFLVFLVKCCSRSSLKPARPMCDGRPFASPLFCRLAGRGSFSPRFPFRWALRLAFSLTRRLALQDAGDVLPHECDYSCHT